MDLGSAIVPATLRKCGSKGKLIGTSTITTIAIFQARRDRADRPATRVNVASFHFGTLASKLGVNSEAMLLRMNPLTTIYPTHRLSAIQADSSPCSILRFNFSSAFLFQKRKLPLFAFQTTLSPAIHSEQEDPRPCIPNIAFKSAVKAPQRELIALFSVTVRFGSVLLHPS